MRKGINQEHKIKDNRAIYDIIISKAAPDQRENLKKLIYYAIFYLDYFLIISPFITRALEYLSIITMPCFPSKIILPLI